MFQRESLDILKLSQAIKKSDAILIGAGAGLSSAAGLSYSGNRFKKYFNDFITKYHLQDMYSAGFYPYPSLEKYWAYWSRHIYYNRYLEAPKDTYKKLLNLLINKDYFVITTNVDHQFQIAGFIKEKLFYTQGDYGLWQCSKPCHQKTYDNYETVVTMIKQQHDLKIPSSLIPYCPICNAPMTMNLRCDKTFVQDSGWYHAQERYYHFLNKYHYSKIVYLELGVGYNTPGIIKYPFWQLTIENPKAIYACINQDIIDLPSELKKQTIMINDNIHNVLSSLEKLL